MKKIDGVWGVEAYGYDGWERIATAFFEKGTYRSASADHYSIGSYSLDGRALVIKAKSHQWGKVRFALGDKKRKNKVFATGKLKRDGTLEATFKASGRFKLSVRYTRLADI